MTHRLTKKYPLPAQAQAVLDRRADAVAKIAAGPWPYVDSALVTKLKALFPPRCRLPSESEREHERYAGKVALVELLAERASTQNKFTVE